MTTSANVLERPATARSAGPVERVAARPATLTPLPPRKMDLGELALTGALLTAYAGARVTARLLGAARSLLP